MLRCLFVLTILMLTSCAVPLSRHAQVPADLGVPVSHASILESFNQIPRVRLEKIKVADWAFGQAFIDPADTKAVLTRKIDYKERVNPVYIYALRHPSRGLYLIDAGFSENYKPYFGPLLRKLLKDGDLQVHLTPAAWLSGQADASVQGIFVTHLHYDHFQGIADLKPDLPIYVGANAGTNRHWTYRAIGRPNRRVLKGRPPLRAWNFAMPSEDDPVPAVDVFGDGSVFALYVPGHTPGSTAYLVHAVDGSHLVMGDAFHTFAGWRGEVLEATGPKGELDALWAGQNRLRTFVQRLPELILHPGHDVRK